jgi:hypothetical protein
MLAGQGMRNGRLYIGDDAVDPSTIPSLSEIRRTRMGSNPDVETRPSPSLSTIAELQVCLSFELGLLHLITLMLH